MYVLALWFSTMIHDLNTKRGSHKSFLVSDGLMKNDPNTFIAFKEA
jgi:hypothetical protein